MGNSLLKINEVDVPSNELTYNDLVYLYREFIDRNGYVPLTRDCVSKNNLPQGRIINRILKENNVTYNDFMNMFGKVSRVRTNGNSNYDFYVERFKEVCQQLGRTLTSPELINNTFGLPNPTWFIKYCPDKNVNKYSDFILYCGLQPAKHIWSKEEVAEKLILYEKELGRPIINEDISENKIGFSSIVINRLYGGLTAAKEEIGLKESIGNQPMPFSYYKRILSNAVLDYKLKTGNEYISWSDIECGKYGDTKVNHKAVMQSFDRENVDVHSFIKSLGCKMNPSDFSFTHTFDNGERVSSKYEYVTSQCLRNLELEYKKDYFRSVKYRDFSDVKSRIDCDYEIVINNEHFYIEVAGIISNYNGCWKDKQYKTKIEKEYLDKMIQKENIFVSNGLKYLFLFPEDYSNDEYINKILAFLNMRNPKKGG